MDGIFRRKDRDGYFISWIDADGTRKKKKAAAYTTAEVRAQLHGRRRARYGDHGMRSVTSAGIPSVGFG